MAAVRQLDGPTVRDALPQSLLTAGDDATVTEVAMPVLRERVLGLPTPPKRVTVLPRDLTVAAELVDTVAPATSRHADDRNEPAVG